MLKAPEAAAPKLKTHSAVALRRITCGTRADGLPLTPGLEGLGCAPNSDPLRDSAAARSVKNLDLVEFGALLSPSEIPPASVNLILKPLHFQVAVRPYDPLNSWNPPVPNHDVLIVGGGLAGLCCALHLHQAGRNFLLLEGSDHIGGRLRTDLVD